jgi:hypothetical protein
MSEGRTALTHYRLIRAANQACYVEEISARRNKFGERGLERDRVFPDFHNSDVDIALSMLRIVHHFFTWNYNNGIQSNKNTFL